MSSTLHALTRTEIDQIKGLIADAHEALCEGGYSKTLPLHLTELCRVIRVLMDAKADTDDQNLKVALPTLQLAARKEKRAIEERLAVRN